MQPTRSTKRTPPDTAVPPRINQTNNNISDLFRPRIQPHRFVPARTITITTPPPATPLDVIAASLAIEQKLKRYGDPAWSVALDRVRKSVTMLTKCLSMARTGLDITRYLHPPTQGDWDHPFNTPTTVHGCSTQLREAKQKVKELVQNSFPQRDTEQRERIKALAASPFKSDKEHEINSESCPNSL